ncbi:MAG: Glu-tRNA(Gln) amidotransferase subunit GatE [Candidatus Aenigmarchaeota archaeon]|nr:Glu-tRNA(Gln) amidotransferase subunit GatE [Candidatus Aenigmarchaeota archaeon]
MKMTGGLEIHQRLDTKEKLFCRCRTTFSEKPLPLEIRRKLRAVAGETGEVDVAAQHEVSGGKEFIYKTYPTESCLICSDSEPPRPLNLEALDISLEITLLLNCEIPDEIQVMRKTVLDGSNTTGFQRTAVVGMNGWVEVSFGKVGIMLVALEEEACQILKKEKNRTVFGLNRLGIPMVEIATAPDIKTPEQAKEVAEKLGMILRSSRVQRGIGSIRQDVNVSVPGGERTEIKGFQNLKEMPRVIEGEVKRQLSLVKKGKKVERTVRKANPDGSTSFLRPLPGAARMYPETDVLPVKITKDIIDYKRKNLPELLEKKQEKLTKELGIDSNLVKALEKAGKMELFQQLPLKKTKPQFAATVLLSYPGEVKKRGGELGKVNAKQLTDVFEKLGKGEISKDMVIDSIVQTSLGKKPAPSKGKVDLEAEVHRLLKEKPGLSFGAYMGILMGKLRGQVSGEDISRALKKGMKG